MTDAKPDICQGCINFHRSPHSGTCLSCLTEKEYRAPGEYPLFFAAWPRPEETVTRLRIDPSAPEYTGGSVSYYRVQITNPTSNSDAYQAECNDIIEALGMNYAEGNAFKAIWRKCAARTLGKAKAGYEDGLYDAEKVVFFGQRMVSQEKYRG